MLFIFQAVYRYRFVQLNEINRHATAALRIDEWTSEYRLCYAFALRVGIGAPTQPRPP